MNRYSYIHYIKDRRLAVSRLMREPSIPNEDIVMKNVINIFRALSDPTRLRILLLLRGQELCVCEITHVLDMEQSRISHQMRVLRDSGLVEDRREGRWIIYRIPSRSRGIVEGILSEKLFEPLDTDPKILNDARKLNACLKKNLRARFCGEPKENEARGKALG